MQFCVHLSEAPQGLDSKTYLHTRPQIDWIQDDTGDVIVNELIRFEHLVSQIVDLRERMRFERRELGRINESERRNYGDYLSHEAKRF